MDWFKSEVQEFIERYPNIDYIDLIFTDVNGTPRGKRIPVSAVSKVGKGIYLPVSTNSLDNKGGVVEQAGLGEKIGEPDNLCFPVKNSLRPSVKKNVGQLLLTMLDSEGKNPTPYSARNVLASLLEKLHAKNIFPVVALELEFYLIDKKRNAEGGLQTAINPSKKRRDSACEVYNIEDLDDYSDFLNDINIHAKAQGINTSGALSESAPGQFEINFYHSKDLLSACDQIISAKRLIKQIAHQHNFDATFMAKPFQDEAGNGKHIHLSVVDEHGKNLFSNEDGKASPLFYKTISAMLAQIPESMSLLCPNVNSYRRFVPGSFTPLRADWGYNHRGVALRIPESDANNRRIEHRIAGADANPYILTSVMLAGLLASDTFSAEQCPIPLNPHANKIPVRMSDALENLVNSQLSNYLPTEFLDMYLSCKSNELAEFERIVTPIEMNWMLHSA